MFTRLAASLLLLLTLPLVGGCQSGEARATKPTHTLAPQTQRFEGYFVARSVETLAVEPSDLAAADDARVSAGSPLTTAEAQQRAAAAEELAERLTRRIGAARALASKVDQGAASLSYAVDTGLPAADVRAAEREVAVAVLAHTRALTTENGQTDAARGDSAATAAVKAEIRLARAERVHQLRGLLDTLVGQAEQARSDALATALRLRAVAPVDGKVQVRDAEVSLVSAEKVLVFVATEAQVEALRTPAVLTVSARTGRVGTATLLDLAFDETASTSSQTPRYRMRFAVEPDEAGFDPLDHATASLEQQSETLAVPAAYLGQDEGGAFVLRAGERIGVTVTRDAQGQAVIVAGAVQPGDRLEWIGP